MQDDSQHAAVRCERFHPVTKGWQRVVITLFLWSLASPCFHRKSTTHLFTHSHLHVRALQFLSAFSRSDGTGGSFITLLFTFREKHLFSKLIRNGSAVVLSGPVFRHGGRKEGSNPGKQKKKKKHNIFPKASFTQWVVESVSFQKYTQII